ncbi:hypothetical protein OG863_15695 [Streptomyces decoyicus]|uniref:Uncharacterized protein n=1 Tax=Streptomyces decoyicus TaxID=249567 RepID=A0ABZ1FGK2_9ACTN|nr:hypothetical protein [Streptomyces decoyicus]WSB69281.1 hypothetical protein OG863_15695 [Streptomyces decoyicus]
MDVHTLAKALRLRSEKWPERCPHAGGRVLGRGLSGHSAVLLSPSGLEFVRTLGSM